QPVQVGEQPIDLESSSTMYKRLSAEQYQFEHSEERGETVYSFYRALDSPAILVSEVDQTPLAVVHYACQETEHQKASDGTRGRTQITNRQGPPKGHLGKLAMGHSPHQQPQPLQRLQAMSTANNQEVEFTITNLWHNGNLNFDILSFREAEYKRRGASYQGDGA